MQTTASSVVYLPAHVHSVISIQVAYLPAHVHSVINIHRVHHLLGKLVVRNTSRHSFLFLRERAK